MCKLFNKIFIKLKKIKFINLYLIISLNFLLLVCSLSGQSIARWGLPYIKNYYPYEYNGYSQNWDIAFDSTGILWLANGDGLMSFDGIRWHKYFLPTNDAIASIVIDNGRIYVGSKNEFGYFLISNPKTYKYVSLTDKAKNLSFSNNYFLSAAKTNYGIYLSDKYSVVRLIKDKVDVLFTNVKGDLINFNNSAFFYNPKTGLYLLSGSKLLYIKGNYPLNSQMFMFLPYANDTLLIIDATAGIYKGILDIDNISSPTLNIEEIDFPIEKELLQNSILDAKKTSDSYIFSTYFGGTYVYDLDFKLQYILNHSSQLISLTHNKIALDPNENIWLAMDYGIAKVNTHNPFTLLSKVHGLTSSILDVIFFNNKLIAGGWTNLFVEEIEESTNYFKKTSIDNICWQLKKIKFDKDSFVIVASNIGLYALDYKNNIIPIDTGNFRTINVTSSPTYFTATTENFFNIYNYKNKKIVKTFSIPLPVGITFSNINFRKADSSYVHYISCDEPKIIKITTTNELQEIQVLTLPTKKVFSSGYLLEKDKNSILVYSPNNIWRLNINNYKITLAEPALRNFYDSLHYINILKIFGDTIWLQTSSKQLPNKTIYLIIKENGKYVTKKTLQLFHELEVLSIKRGPNGNILFSTDDGIFVLNQKKLFKKSAPLRLYATLHVDAKDTNYMISNYSFIDTVIKIPYPLNKLSIEWRTNLIEREMTNNIKFSFYLEGYDRDWSEWTTHHSREYDKLKPGNYTFHVKAIDENEQITTLVNIPLHINVPIYRTVVSYIFYIILGILAIYAIVYFSNRLILRRNKLLEEYALTKNKETLQKTMQLEKEKEKADRLLINILPVRIANELKEKGKVDAEFYSSVSVIFTDFTSFSQLSDQLDSELVVNNLDYIFGKFDEICVRNKLEKLKTIGDSHMSVGGIPIRNQTHAIDTALAALEMQQFIQKFYKINPENERWKLRVGINTGEVVAGVVGKRKFAFDIWGDTVNTANRLQSTCESNKINISATTYELLKDFFDVEYRGEISIKYKGPTPMYYLLRIKEEYSNDDEGYRPNKDFWDKYNTLVDYSNLINLDKWISS